MAFSQLLAVEGLARGRGADMGWSTVACSMTPVFIAGYLLLERYLSGLRLTRC